MEKSLQMNKSFKLTCLAASMLCPYLLVGGFFGLWSWSKYLQDISKDVFGSQVHAVNLADLNQLNFLVFHYGWPWAAGGLSMGAN